MKLQLPLKQIMVTQGFGLNYLNFYKELGMVGHSGIDFMAKDGCPVYAAHDGKVIIRGTDSGGGKEIRVWNKENNFLTGYCHLKDFKIDFNEGIIAGQLIGTADNTGKMSTGNHLHFFMKLTDDKGNTIDKENGYYGAIDPAPYFTCNYQGKEFKNKDWDKSNAYHRYWRPDRNIKIEIRILCELARYFRRLPTCEEINACVYAAWDRESLKNPAMAYNWKYCTKGDILSGHFPFQ